MAVEEHFLRSRIISKAQHPYRHTLDEFSYTSEALPEVTNLQSALDWILAVLYPKTQASVANQAALPAVGNAVNDMRVVLDDGDGRAATYRWEQREGEVSASWHKIYDMDWGYDSILTGFRDQTLDIYVNKRGYDDLDEDGVALTGVNAGQHIFGGKTANTHLTLHANSGDGTGAQTGYVQLADHLRPTADSTVTLGTTAERWLKVWTDELTAGTLTLAAGSITDSSGAIDFGDEDLSTTGEVAADTFSSLTATIGTLSLAGGSITDSSGSISFGNENLSTSGTVTAGTLSIAGGSITDSSGAISFGNENLTTTGTLSAGNTTVTRLDADNIRLDGNSINSLDVDGDLIVSGNGAGEFFIERTLNTWDVIVDGSVDISSNLDVGNIHLTGNDISVADVDGDLQLTANGAGTINLASDTIPINDGSLNLGAASFRWNNFYLDGSLHDGTDEITIATLLSFRDALVGAADGDSLIYDDASGTWQATPPDSGISHGDLSDLLVDDHTQYALLAGRAGGQTLKGGTASGDDLTLESTNHATKGSVIWIGTLEPSADNTYDFGTSSKQIKDAYIAGQLIGARLQNATTAGRPSASAGTVGRLVYDTDLQDIFVDRGGTWKKLSLEKYAVDDASGWDGVVTSVVYTVSSEVSDARECIWSLKDNSNSYEQLNGLVYTASQTQVTVTSDSGIPLPAGTYKLVGVG